MPESPRPAPRKKATPKPPADPFERARMFCLGFPEVTERPSHGEPAFFVTFSVDHHHDGEEALWIKAAPGVQEMLIDDDSEHYFRPPYVGPSGWVAARMDRKAIPWADIEALIRDAWMLAAFSVSVSARSVMFG